MGFLKRVLDISLDVEGAQRWQGDLIQASTLQGFG